MKNFKGLLLIALALLTGLAAAAYATGWVAQRAAVSANKVVVAAVDIELGSRITPEMVKLTDWPAGSVPPGAFADIKDVQQRTLKTSITRGEPIIERKLAPVGTLGGLSAVISEGKRAMTVRVNDVVGVAGFALPGTYVDVMVNTQQDRGKNEAPRPVSKTVLEQVLVLAVAQEAGRDATKPMVVNAVTLELTPQDAEKLDLARNVGTLSLVLRNQVDKAEVDTKGITKDELFGNVPQKPLAVVAPPPRPKVVRAVAATGPCVEVLRDSGRYVSCF
ncbi:Flp pilus assembly protein CpaB [Massilia terrae]|uniref:Flp pilus assembly protein CpaB n=1 Tax=Massilia terrae TaxID=1811224 RepID=A0ABT2CXH1_9BURK|nr:Flp pilus assembly protein CpaB [Massilia terrae]MCS0658549.1 Flp pilus assembly protein CpaB [Massilia terrae]